MEENTSNMFTLLPMNQRFSLKPGETYEGSITVVNPADATSNFAYKAEVTPYSVIAKEHSDYDMSLAEETNYTYLAKWIKIEEPTGEVKPNESKKVKFTITVPEDAPGGGQYATIAVSSNQSNTSSKGVNVQNVFEMASIIYGTVDGETIHKGEILENNVPDFAVSTPIKLSALISNDGNVHEDATFSISVSDYFSGRVILPTEEDEGIYGEVVMPETTRFIEREVDNLPALGAIKVNQTIYYQGVSSSIEKVILICPIWFLVLVILTIAAIIATIVHLVKKHRKKAVAI